MNRGEIVAQLQVLGLKNGDIVLLHSSLASIGNVEGGADTVVDAFLETLGEDGTLIVPVFGDLGIITKTLKSRPDAVVSLNPKASVAAIGQHAETICADAWKAETAHGEGTPYLKIAELGGYVCLLGVDQDRNTTLHSVEELLELPYLKATEDVTFQTPEGEVTKSWKYFPGPHRDFIGLDKYLRESGKMSIGKIGNSVMRLIKSKDLIDICLEIGKKNPAFVLCDNPNCADCVMQKADLTRDIFSKETFTIATSSVLAGKYVPEIIENMKNAGINDLELDFIEGMPWYTLDDEKLGKVVKELRDCNINVISFRLNVIPEGFEHIITKVSENKINRIVMPISSDSERYAKSVAEKNVSISFYNNGMCSDKCSKILLKLKDAGITAGFTFNAPGFAGVGEKPFLESYKKKLRRFVDQLDIEDALFDETPTELAKGNAEIKEMISILRCASFSGNFVIGSRNRAVTDLHGAVERFKSLLQNM